MYWLNGIVSQLSLTSAIRASAQAEDAKNKPSSSFPRPSDIVSMAASPHASLFVTCTATALYLWSVKPVTMLSFVQRSEKHIDEFGENKSVLWKPDATAIVIMTTKNYLLLYAIINFDQRTFEFNFAHSHHAHVSGPGEGGGPRTILLKFRLAIRVDAGVSWGTSSDDTLIIATEKPAAIQCISWNPHEVNSTQTSIQHKLGILRDPTERVVLAKYDRAMNISVWISDAGHAYFILNARGAGSPKERRKSRSSTGPISPPLENGDHRASLTGPISPTMPSYRDTITWNGICFHEAAEAEHAATCVAINAKFSLIAVGTKSGKVFVYSAQNYTSPPALSHTLSLVAYPSSDPISRRADQGEYEVNVVTSLEWTSDGYAVAVGYQHRGLAIWSVYGNLLSSINETDDIFLGHKNDADMMSPSRSQDAYVRGIDTLFWGPGNHQLFVLSMDYEDDSRDPVHKLYTLPFAKSAITNFHNSDNARRGLLQTDDRVLVYNYGGDYQENNTTTIDPDAVMWTQVLYPPMYITDHWPIRYSSISSDGKFIAVAGRRGFAHYNTFSNRWKLFGNQQQEQSFLVRGGMVWYKNLLLVACETSGTTAGKNYEVRVYNRDNNLDNAYILHTETLSHVPLYLNVCGNYLLVYTAENVLSIYTIIAKSDSATSMSNGSANSVTARLERVRRVTFGGIVARVTRVRGISLFGSYVGDQMNNMNDVITANILILVDGKLIMLCPRVPDDDDDSDLTGHVSIQSHYDVHVICNKTEYYWIGRKSIANLCNSLWAVDDHGIKMFPNLLRNDECSFQTFGNDVYESEPSTPTTPSVLAARANIGRPYSLGYHIGPEPASPSMSVVEMEGFSCWHIPNFDNLEDGTIHIPLDFYPHSVLLEKGVIVGVEQGMVYRESLGFVMFKMSTKTHLFLHHVLQYLLRKDFEEDAVVFARAYERLIYFGHSLEILLHTVLEEETEHRVDQDAILPLVIKFLDQFPHALDVIVSCARKTEVALWDHLFSAVGAPKDLFELCLSDGRLRTATSYLIILQTMQPLAVGGKDTIRLLQRAMDMDDYELCKELVRFLSSIDNSGKTLEEALQVIKSRMNQDNPLSPHSEDAQVDKVVQSIQGLSLA
ncbi:RIC1-domain-containing protein [Syncephalastrum racemosum]|uniref:RIC1-domain-containing protein n=1 Tax=Syncephalastrum racemosum TaxID=13706 RepID=A0A1X2HEW9_SYNRA|nr:RIC1-domain-containing protein [Syncephalastrum racemosum]